MAATMIAIFCAVDREPIPPPHDNYALTVNAALGRVVYLAFCEDHYDEWVALYAVISGEGWK